MSANISDSTLYQCQRLLAHHYLYFRACWSNVAETKHLADALDEIDAAVSGDSIENVRKARVEKEKQPTEQIKWEPTPPDAFIIKAKK